MNDRIINVDLTVKGEDIDAICDAAFYGGISYWAHDLEVVKRPENDKRDDGSKLALSEFISRGGELAITADGQRHILTVESILMGYKKYGTEHGFDVEQYDAGDADSIIQYAVFGELVYG